MQRLWHSLGQVRGLCPIVEQLRLVVVVVVVVSAPPPPFFLMSSSPSCDCQWRAVFKLHMCVSLSHTLLFSSSVVSAVNFCSSSFSAAMLTITRRHCVPKVWDCVRGVQLRAPQERGSDADVPSVLRDVSKSRGSRSPTPPVVDAFSARQHCSRIAEYRYNSLTPQPRVPVWVHQRGPFAREWCPRACATWRGFAWGALVVRDIWDSG
jgi:hypothetical protein